MVYTWSIRFAKFMEQDEVVFFEQKTICNLRGVRCPRRKPKKVFTWVIPTNGLTPSFFGSIETYGVTLRKC